jgi:DNA ligase (NAD+)
MAEKSARNLQQAVLDSKSRGMRRLFYALGIQHAGEGTARRLCRHYENLEQVAAASVEELERIEDIGPIVAKSIYDYFRSDVGYRTLLDLKGYGVSLERKPEDAPVEPSEASESAISGKKVVVTGKLTQYTRDGIQDALRAAGAQVSGSVSKSTDILVVGEKAGSKLKTAQELGVEVWTETQLQEALS